MAPHGIDVSEPPGYRMVRRYLIESRAPTDTSLGRDARLHPLGVTFGGVESNISWIPPATCCLLGYGKLTKEVKQCCSW
jgi:hypothetical protein